MHCPQCNTYHYLKLNPEMMHCPKCNYCFVFLFGRDPISDSQFIKLTHGLRFGETYVFTQNQLLYALIDYLENTGNWKELFSLSFWTIVIAAVIWIIIGDSDEYLFALVFSLGIVAAVGRIYTILQIQRARFSYDFRAKNFHTLAKHTVQRYQQNNLIPGLVEGDSLLQYNTLTAANLLSFSPKAILFVERNDLVDLLVQSRFYLHQQIAIICPNTGYPYKLSTALPKFLHLNPSIPVLLMHDFSKQGVGWLEQLKRDPQWQFLAENLHDIGLVSHSFYGYAPRQPWVDRQGKLTFSYNPNTQLRTGGCFALDALSPHAICCLLSFVIEGEDPFLSLKRISSNGYEHPEHKIKPNELKRLLGFIEY